ncbi:small nuclear RNA activating complex, subunit SNAP43-domain-containing protein, partial [Chlamydoabsidia padenii]
MKKLTKKNPASFYESTDLISISLRYGIPCSIIRGDVELLLNTFMAQENHTFRSFETVWRQLNFDHIHFACLDKDCRSLFMIALYELVFDHFAINIDQAKFGVIYALYFLYISQPTVWPIHRIRVDKARWIQLFDFYIYCCHLDSKEGAQVALIFRQMKDEHEAFVFAVNHKLDRLNILEKKEKEQSHRIMDGFHDIETRKFQNDATSTCYDQTTTDLKSLAQLYQDAKQRAAMTPQATLATQQWIKDSLHINETNQTRLQNVMLKNVLRTRDVAFVDMVNEAGRRMWAARADWGLNDTDVMEPHYLPSRRPPQVDTTTQQEDGDIQEEGSSQAV